MKHHIKHTIKHLAFGFVLLFIAVLVLHFLQIIPGFWGSKMVWLFYVSLALAFGFLFWEISDMTEEEKEQSSWIKFISYMFLLSLIVLALNQFLKRQIILDFQVEIIVLSIVLGVLTFYLSRNRVENELEEEKLREDALEEVRKNEFAQRFPNINKVWVLRGIVKWMYKEGWWYSWGLVAVVLLGFGLRLWRLGEVSFWWD